MAEKKQITPETVVKRNPEVLVHTIDKDVVLILPDGKYWGLEAIGAHIWNVLETPTPVSTVITTMQDSYEGDAEQISKQVIAFITALCNRKIASVESAEQPEV